MEKTVFPSHEVPKALGKFPQIMSFVKRSHDVILGSIDHDIILNSINEGVAVVGLDKEVYYLNRAGEEMLGRKMRDLIGKPCREVFHCQQDEGLCLMERTIANKENISNFETAIQNYRGELIPVSINTSILRSQSGKMIGGVKVFRDMTRTNGNEDLVTKAEFTQNPLNSLERELIIRILEQSRWRFREAAARLQVSRTTLWRKMKCLGIYKKKDSSC